MQIDEALATPFELDHNGKRYTVSRVTLEIRGRINVWLKQRMLREAKDVLSPEEYLQTRKQILASDGGVADPSTLAEALGTIEGSLFMLRCCLKGKDTPSDEELFDILKNSKALETIFEILKEELADPKNLLALLIPG